MVTDVTYPLESIGQLYRDRADCENGFDELKNQWGLSGFTTQDINRCQTTARACALVFAHRKAPLAAHPPASPCAPAPAPARPASALRPRMASVRLC